jgi:hypothetical protein
MFVIVKSKQMTHIEFGTNNFNSPIMGQGLQKRLAGGKGQSIIGVPKRIVSFYIPWTPSLEHVVKT